MGFESSRAFAIEIFSTIETIEQSRILWEELLGKSREIYMDDKKLIGEFLFFNTNLRPFTESILRLYLQSEDKSEWLNVYTQTPISDYLALIEYVREKLEEALKS